MASVKLNGKAYPIRFDMAAIKTFQDKYKDVTDVLDKAKSLGELCWILSVLINEARKLDALETGTPARMISSDEVGILLTPADFSSGEASQAVVDAFNESLGPEKKLTQQDLTTLASSMQEAAEGK